MDLFISGSWQVFHSSNFPFEQKLKARLYELSVNLYVVTVVFYNSYSKKWNMKKWSFPQNIPLFALIQYQDKFRGNG